MCGIGGILRVWDSGDVPRPLDAIPEAWLDILDESIKHRGPDGRGRFRQRIRRPDGAILDVALVHRRLSIIDHAGGAQPMVIGTPMRTRSASECGPPGAGREGNGSRSTGGRSGSEGSFFASSAQAADTTPALLSLETAPYTPIANPHICPRCQPGITAVVFNGCIYNHRDLRRELQAAGHEFFSDHSDTEVLLHGWREWGAGLLDRLDGMYAFLIWDESTGCVCFARDEFGEKPLYNHLNHEQRTFAWSSEAAGLIRAIPALGRPIPFRWGLDGPRWIAVGTGPDLPTSWCYQLGAGEACLGGPFAGTNGLGYLQLERTRVLGAERARDASLTADRTADLVEASVRSRLEADVPVACFLSGGVDSSLLAALSKQVLGELRTFTVRMPAAEYDESAAAASVASLLGTRHETLDAEPTPAADLVELIQRAGLPFGDSSLLPAHWLSRATRRHVKVAISGDGGDELFAGYERHVALRWLARYRPLAAAIPSPLLPRSNPKSNWSKAARLGVAARSTPNWNLAAIFPGPDERRLLGHSMHDGWRMTRSGIADGPLWDARFYLPEDLLRKTDTASMAVALEVRAPFLQRDLALAALSEPLSSLMPHGQRKGLLRAVARKYLPADIVDRPKQGFAIPISDWFRTDFGGMRQLLLDHLHTPDPFPGLANAGIHLNMGFIRQMLKEHDAAGQKSLWPWKGRDHGQRLYMLLVLSIWCRWLERVRAGG